MIDGPRDVGEPPRTIVLTDIDIPMPRLIYAVFKLFVATLLVGGGAALILALAYAFFAPIVRR